MVKSARKRKVASGDVVVAHDTRLGVRTRSKTQQAAAYLELRSRRLQKRAPARRPRRSAGRPAKQQAQVTNPVVLKPEVAAAAAEEEELGSLQIRTSFGDNALKLEGGRNGQEGTPCSLIRDLERVVTPGSSTMPSKSTLHKKESNDACQIVPSSQDVEDLFAKTTLLQQQVFAEKYNFDPVKEQPLPGRYEWVKLVP